MNCAVEIDNTQALIDSMKTNKVAYEKPHSWIYLSQFDGKWTISVQYLDYQGPEFHIQFNDMDKADIVLQQLFQLFEPNKKPEVEYGHGWSKRNYEFTVKNCLNPTALLEFAQQYFDHAELVFTPKTFAMHNVLFGDKEALVREHYIHRNIEDVFKRYSFIPFNEEVKQLMAA